MEVLIIGGIAAGMSVAAKALRTNKEAKITLVEMEDYISFGACGLPYYLGGQFENENNMYARRPDQMREAGLNLLLEHKAQSVDFEKKRVEILNLKNNETIHKSYDRLMIATGASAIIPPVKGIDAKNVYTITKPEMVNDLKSKLKDYKNIAIIGGGFIGVEVAEQMRGLDKKVHLIEGVDAIMKQPFDGEFSEKIEMALKEAGVDVITNRFAEEFILEDDLVKQVKIKDNVFEVDAVILAAGFKPNTKFLDGQLEMLDNGAIVIDAYGQTSIQDVFSAGDCATVNHRLSGTQYIPLATYANKLGRLIGTNIVSDKKEWLAFNGALGSSAVKVGDYEAVVTGLSEKEALNLDFNIKTTLIETNNHANYYPNQSKIMIKLVYDAKTFVLYGAQMFGERDVVLRATGLTTAIHAGLTTKDIGFIDYAYSPPFASTWEALNVAANTAK